MTAFIVFVLLASRVSVYRPEAGGTVLVLHGRPFTRYVWLARLWTPAYGGDEPSFDYAFGPLFMKLGRFTKDGRLQTRRWTL